jgi:flagellar motor switch protein FliM
MDGTVAAIILDGVLGGDGSAVPKFDPSGLTAAQKALVARVATNIVDNITEALGPSLGLSLRIVPANDDAPDEATPLTCVFEVATGELRGNLVLALAKDAVLTRTKAAALAQVHPPSPKVAAFLETVEVEVIAELGRDRKRLAEVTNLRVGDILRLDVPVNEHVKVRVGNNASFVGEPTAVSGQVAIRFVRWHEDWKPGE